MLAPFCRSFVAPLLLTALSMLSAAAHGGPDPLENGLTLRIYDVGRSMDRLYPLAPDQTPNVDRKIDRLVLTSSQDFGGFEDFFVVEAFGDLVIDEPGRYRFATASDDGSSLHIDERLVVMNDGLHAVQRVEGDIELTAGRHPFRVRMFENQGGQALRLEWQPPGASEFVVVPSEAFRTETGVTRVVAPGTKKILDGKEHLEPGDGLPLDEVHPAWRVTCLRPEGFEPQVGAMDFLPDGRLILTSFEPVNNGVFREAPNGTVWVLEGALLSDERPLRTELIADGFHDPSGLAVVDGEVFISDRIGLTRLRDADGDGLFESREVFAEPWTSDNYHHFSFGLAEHDGWLYGTLSTSIYFDNTLAHDQVERGVVSMNGPNPAHRGTCYRIHLETREVEWLAGGFRTPNGLEITRDGRIFVTDNQGAWLPANKLVEVRPGRFYGHYNGTQRSADYPRGGEPALFHERGATPPTLWLPQNEVSNSPTTPLEITRGPFRGQLYLAELTAGGIRRAFLETVAGVTQGAVFRHSQGLECGVNRLIAGPDGCLYAGGTGADGNWNWRGTRFGLERLEPTGETTFEMLAMRATPDGFVVEYTEPVAAAWLEDPSNYALTQWRYVPTPEYGGPKRELQRLGVTEAIADASLRSVRLRVAGLREGSVVHLRAKPKSLAGRPIWSPEAWYTLHRLPETKGATAPQPIEASRLEDFRKPHSSWRAALEVALDDLEGTDGRPVVMNSPGARDLETLFEHGDARVEVEFRIPEGSNSGVYLQGRYEIQILDSYGRADPRHSDCGGIYQRWDPARGSGNEGYEGRSPRVNAARPAGEWQSYVIDFRAPRFSPLGNKVENARFERVVHNGTVIHEDVELTGPTRGGHTGEVPFGSLRLQGDHGPVAFRELRIAPLPPVSRNSSAKTRVLVFSKTAGYRHGSIPAGVTALREIGGAAGYAVEATEDANIFTPAGLHDFSAVIFLNTTGDILDPAQQRSFQEWFRAGGGFVGVHSASDTEYDWPWYGRLVGAYFESHPRIQEATLDVVDWNHPSTRHLPPIWLRTDEWYNFRAKPRGSVAVLLRLRESSYHGGTMGIDHPVAWCSSLEGGRSFYTAGGHTEESFDDPAFRVHLLGGLRWVLESPRAR